MEKPTQLNAVPFGVWFSVDERLPPPRVFVLVRVDDRRTYGVAWRNDHGEWVDVNGSWSSVGKVLQWLAFPSADEED